MEYVNLWKIVNDSEYIFPKEHNMTGSRASDSSVVVFRGDAGRPIQWGHQVVRSVAHHYRNKKTSSKVDVFYFSFLKSFLVFYIKKLP